MADLIRQHQCLARGEHVDVGGDTGSAFVGRKRDMKSVGKRQHMPDSSRGLAHFSREADHGPHGMNTDSDGD